MTKRGNCNTPDKQLLELIRSLIEWFKTPSSKNFSFQVILDDGSILTGIPTDLTNYILEVRTGRLGGPTYFISTCKIAGFILVYTFPNPEGGPTEGLVQQILSRIGWKTNTDKTKKCKHSNDCTNSIQKLLQQMRTNKNFIQISTAGFTIEFGGFIEAVNKNFVFVRGSPVTDPLRVAFYLIHIDDIINISRHPFGPA